MRNRQKIFLIIGTLIFSLLIFTLARQEHYIKTTRVVYHAVTNSKIKVYRDTDPKSTVIATLPANTKITVAKVVRGFYRIVEHEGSKPLKESYVKGNTISIRDTLLQ